MPCFRRCSRKGTREAALTARSATPRRSSGPTASSPTAPTPSAPRAPLSSTVLTERDFDDLTVALTRHGFNGPTGYYLNHDVNARYADAAPGGRVLRLPVLFVGAAYDQVADLRAPAALNAMRSTCPNLTEATVPAGHWLHMEAAPAVNEHIESWLTGRVPGPPW